MAGARDSFPQGLGDSGRSGLTPPQWWASIQQAGQPGPAQPWEAAHLPWGPELGNQPGQKRRGCWGGAWGPGLRSWSLALAPKWACPP